MIRSVGSFRCFRLDKFEAGHVEADRLRQELFCQPSTSVLRQTGAGGLFPDDVGETDELSRGRVFDTVFF